MRAREHLLALVRTRLPEPARTWLDSACDEIGKGVDDARFAARISLASRHAPRGKLAPLAPTGREIAAANAALEGWNPERWSALEAVRVLLVLARPDLEQESCLRALEGVFRYADMGESCALHRAIAFLPGPSRWVWRAGEGCRSSIGAVYQAAATDTPFPAKHFDELAWRQLVIKALFVEAPLWRVWGLDTRLDAELARMALDLADERRSAGRPVQHELWLCLGTHAGKRGMEALERELAGSSTLGRRGAAIGLARAGGVRRLEVLLGSEREASVAATMRAALAGETTQTAFRALDPTLQPA